MYVYHILLRARNIHCMQGYINMPRAFQCSILPRSGQHEAVLCQEFRNTEGSFASFEQDWSAEDDKSYAQEVRQKA